MSALPFEWIRQTSRTVRYGSILTLATGLGACSDFETVPEVEPVVTAPPTPAALAQHVPTFNIAVDAASFADMTARYEEDIELDVAVSMWRGDAEVLTATPAEIQVKGNGSAGFALKSLGVKLDDARDNSGHDLLDAPTLLPGHTLDEIRSFRLRNGGNDFLGTLLKDLGYARMVAASDLAVVPYYGEPAAAFVNGEFYGLLNLRTEGNANGLSRLTGIRKRDLLLAEINIVPGATEAQPFEVKDGNPEVFRLLEAAISRGDREAALNLVDEESFVDFVLVHAIAAHGDWPWNNVRLYGGDGGRLHFMAFDFDLAAARNADQGLLFHIREGKPNYLTDLFALAYDGDAGFRESFWDRRDELLASGDLAPERLRTELEELAAVYAPVIEHQITAYGHPESRAAWYLQLERHIEQYEFRYRRVEREERE